MPRLRTSAGGSATDAVEFDLCARCGADGDIVRTVLASKFRIAVGPGDPTPVSRVSHRSYDFQPRPIPCISCARILTSEDD